MRMVQLRKALFVCTVLLVILSPLWAVSPSYLHVETATTDDFLQFDEKGILVEQTEVPVALKQGWIVLSLNEPVRLSSSFATILLQPNSMITVGAYSGKEISLYLVAGSANLLVEPSFSGSATISTPVGLYKMSGPGEMFVTSDYSEVVFSLATEISITNAITRQKTILPPFTYLDLADPFVQTKEISRQTYQTLSIAPKTSSIVSLPSLSVSDGITFKGLSTPLVSAEIEKEEPKPVAQEVVAVEPKEEVTEIEVPSSVEGTTIVSATLPEEVEIRVPPAVIGSVSVEEVAVQESEVPVEVVPSVAVEPPVEVEPSFDLYIVHTNDIEGVVEPEGIGFAKLATLLKWGRSVSDRHLLLDAGNTVSGTAIADAFYGESVATLIDMLHYDAVTPSTLEYRWGLDYLLEAFDFASLYSDVAILGANLLDEEQNPLLTPYKIFNLDGFSVGVIGLTLPVTPGLSFELDHSLIESAQLLVDEVASQSDFVVVLGNIGVNSVVTSDEIASTLKNIDLIIDGKEALSPPYGRKVGSTLIVNATSKLSSVGVVALHIRGKQVESIEAIRVTEDDVYHPGNSELAQHFGISDVYDDQEVASFIEGEKSRYEALQREIEEQKRKEEEKAKEILLPTAPVVELSVVSQQSVEPEEEVVVKTPPKEEQTDDLLTIKEPLGIVSKEAAFVEKKSFDYGVTTTFTATREGLGGSNSPKIGVALKPFFNTKNFSLGLQGFFLTEGNLFDPTSYDVTNWELDFTDIPNSIASITQFVDYVRIGEKDSPFYLLIDSDTPISFGNRSMVDSFGITGGPYKKHLGLYSSLSFKKVGVELFVDDLHLTDWIDGKRQHGALRLSIAPTKSFEFGLSSLFSANSSNSIVAYPALDTTIGLKDSRTVGLDLLISLATMVQVDSFSVDSLFNNSGTTVESMFPNFLFTAALDVRVNNWKVRLSGAAQNSEVMAEGNLLSFGSFNSTHYGASRMLNKSEGLFYTFKAEGVYEGEHTKFNLSYTLPVTGDFTSLVALEEDPSLYGDIFSVGASYTRGLLQAEFGFRKVNFFSSTKELISSDDILPSLKEFFIAGAKETQPYVGLAYSSGLFAVGGELAMGFNGTSYLPSVTLYSSFTVGKRAVETALDPKTSETLIPHKERKENSLTLGGKLGTLYSHTYTTDMSYFTIQPVLTLSKGELFSIGLGPKLTVSADDLSLYSHRGDLFSFGSEGSSQFGKIYDTTTDIIGLIDHIEIGSEKSVAHLSVGKEQKVKMGVLVNNYKSVDDSLLQRALPLSFALNTKRVNLNLFVNDLTNLQLGGVALLVRPFKTYQGEISLSAVSSLILKDSSQRYDLFPSVGIKLPLLSKEKTSVALTGMFSTMVGYGDEFKQFLYYANDSGSIITRFHNYLISGGLEFTSGSFDFGLDVAMQEGSLALGMFNALFKRERNTILTTFDKPWAEDSAHPITYVTGAKLHYSGKKFDFGTHYQLPFTTTAFEFENDLLEIGVNLDLNWLDLSLSFAKRGVVDALKNFSFEEFFFDDSTLLNVGASVTQGSLTFSGELNNLVRFVRDTTALNGQLVDSVDGGGPTLSLGVNINLF